MFADVEEATRSNLLTDAGRQDAIAKLRAKARSELLPALDARLALHRARLEQLRNEAIPPRSKPPNQYFLEFEIRQALRGNDAVQNQIVLLDAIKSGDQLTIDAIMDAPPFFKMITSEARQLALQQLFAKSPVASTIQEVQDSAEVHTALREALVRDIETAGVDTVPGPGAAPASNLGDDIEAMAKGSTA
mgnify:CR=1 FL=1